MPKLRNGDTPVAMLTNWLGRKCRNHNPLSELKLTASQREATPRLYQTKRAKDDEILLAREGGRNRILYHNGERAFEIIVNEIPIVEVEDIETETVAY